MASTVGRAAAGVSRAGGGTTPAPRAAFGARGARAAAPPAGAGEGDHAPADPATDQPRAERAGCSRRLDEPIDLRRRHGEVVAQRGMRGVDDLAERADLAALERADERADARVLARDVAHATAQRLRKVVEPGAGPGVAQAREPERLRGGLALGAAFVVRAPRVLVANPRVDHGDVDRRRQRDLLHAQRAKVDEERAAALAEARDELVHPPDPGTHERSLRAVGDLGDPPVVELQTVGIAYRAGGRHAH